MSDATLVSAIVLNYNGGGFVHEAVQSLLDQGLADLELLVVDNASSDGSDAELEARFGVRIRMLRQERNLGWGGGNNAGIRAGRGRYVFALNSDAVVAPGCLRALVERSESDPRIGMAAPKVLGYDRHDLIDTAGHLMYPDGLNRGRGRLEVDRGQYDGCRDALFPSGAAALYRRAMLDEIGLFDEAFFLYGDDAELGLRARLAGWGCAFVPGAVAYHHYSRSAGAWSSLKAFYVERNRLWLLLKLFPAPLILASPWHTAVRFALQAWGALAGRGAAGRLAQERSLLHLALVTLRAWLSAACGVPRVLRQRRSVLRRIDVRAFCRLLAEHRLGAREVALKD
jgi:GT2 family glycosyltransferase